MKVIDYKRTKCYFKVEYDDGDIVKGTINVDEKSISNQTELAKLIIDNEVGDIVEILAPKLRVGHLEKCKILEKKCDLIFEEIYNIEDERKYYQSTYYEKEGFKNIKSTEKLSEDIIYYLYFYKSAEWRIPDTASNLIIKGLKNNKYNPNDGTEEFLKLNNIFYKHFINKFKLAYKDYVFCCVPSHNKSDKNINPISILLRNMCNNNKFIDGTNCLIRYREIEEQKKQGKRHVETHMNSIMISNKNIIEGKKIILVDDIVTSGSSLNACKKILINNGAKEVICFAFGKDQR